MRGEISMSIFLGPAIEHKLGRAQRDQTRLPAVRNRDLPAVPAPWRLLIPWWVPPVLALCGFVLGILCARLAQ